MNCPQCGSNLPNQALQSKLLQCVYCHSTLLIETGRVSKQDLYSRAISRQSLLVTGGLFRWQEQTFKPLGFIQYEHTDGYLTDWWVMDTSGASFWLSEDDENFFLLQDEISQPKIALAWGSIQLNRELHVLNRRWLVTQKQTLYYRGFQGALPVSLIPEIRQTIYLAQSDASVLLLDFTKQGDFQALRSGSWLDPFEIERIQ